MVTFARKVVLVVQDICQKIAMKAEIGGRFGLMAVSYDEARHSLRIKSHARCSSAWQVVRKSWAERAYSNDTSLDIEKEAQTLDNRMLEEAEYLYDQVQAGRTYRAIAHDSFMHGQFARDSFLQSIVKASKGGGKTASKDSKDKDRYLPWQKSSKAAGKGQKRKLEETQHRY